MGPPSPAQSQALREHSELKKNILAVRLVPSSPQLLEEQSLGDDINEESPLPCDPSHAPPPATGTPHDLGTSFALQRSDGVSHRSTSKLQLSPGSSLAARRIIQRDGSLQENPALPPKEDGSIVPIFDRKTSSEVQPPDGPRSSTSVVSSASIIDSHARLQLSRANGGAIATTPKPQSPVVEVDHSTNSPWNYTLVGGLRKVPKTPDQRQRAALNPDSPNLMTSGKSQLTPEPSIIRSSKSRGTESTTSENANYKLYGISPCGSDLETSLADSSFYLKRQPEVENTQTSSNSPIYQVPARSSPTLNRDFDSENYQLHRDLSSSPLARIRTEYSQESLIVPPLRPRAKHSVERFGYYKSHSKESLRTGSLTSISTMLSEEASQAMITSGSVIHIPASKHVTPLSPLTNSAQIHVQEHPHQWSSQLSTILSESEASAEQGSQPWSDDYGRMSSGYLSMHSRQLPNIGSSLHKEDHSGSTSPETLSPVFLRIDQREVTSSAIRVLEQDEWKDGLCPMPDVRPKPSRIRPSDSIVSSDHHRANTMRSVSSSRASSLLASSLPTWAKLYYGGGEKARHPPGSPESTNSPSQSSFLSSSPDLPNLPLSIYSPRQRPREVQRSNVPRQGRSIDITPPPLPSSNSASINNSPQRFRSSSIPHLGKDIRTTRSRRSTFFLEPASLDWSQGGGVLARQKLTQIIMFIIGFILPFTWIIASFLPIAQNPMFELYGNQSNNDFSNIHTMHYRTGTLDEATRYESARWWRNLNRGMSVLGVFIIATVATLVAVGTKQR